MPWSSARGANSAMKCISAMRRRSGAGGATRQRRRDRVAWARMLALFVGAAHDGPSGLSDLNASYRHIMGRLAATLAAFVDGVACNGISDLVYGDRKFSGNAQQRKREHLLHHGTLLYAFELPMINRYLRHPPRMPDYRRNRPHSDFVTNLPLAADRLKELLTNAWEAHEAVSHWPGDVVERLLAEKYGQDEWRQRR